MGFFFFFALKASPSGGIHVIGGHLLSLFVKFCAPGGRANLILLYPQQHEYITPGGNLKFRYRCSRANPRWTTPTTAEVAAWGCLGLGHDDGDFQPPTDNLWGLEVLYRKLWSLIQRRTVRHQESKHTTPTSTAAETDNTRKHKCMQQPVTRDENTFRATTKAVPNASHAAFFGQKNRPPAGGSIQIHSR